MKFSWSRISLVLLVLVVACTTKKEIVSKNGIQPLTTLESGFVVPPDSIQTSVYWYWISDHISKEGVVKDLQAMKKVGINRAFIGNIGLEGTPYGNVKLFSVEWWDILHTALKTATELNIEIGIFNSPGWSQSGGPWVKPSQAMRYLNSSETIINGPLQTNIQLPQPNKEFQDVKVLAFKAPKDYQNNIVDLKPKITSSSEINNLSLMFDKDTATSVAISTKTPISIDFETNTPFDLRSITILPAHQSMYADVKVLVWDNGIYRTISSFAIDRSNVNLNVGFKPYASITVSIPSVKSNKFRVVFSGNDSKLAIKELVLSSSPTIERFNEKSLAKMFPKPLPYWKEYQWAQQPVIADKSLVVDPSEVLDISKYMDANRVLKWTVPAGKWVIMRTGMTPTGVTNGPASPEGVGLETDKMSKEHITSHFDAFLGEILKRIPAEDRKTFKVAVQDSYETGGQNWTDGMLEDFEKNYGYSALPYLPTLAGKVIGSQEQSDRFLWDLRRFVADKVAYDYVGGLREVSHKHGLHTWLENYGHWGFPGEFLQYGGQSDEIAGEFWSEGELGNIENRAASSAAHIYGKTKVSAESSTAVGKTFARYPEMMKQRGDRFFTEGINNTLLHVYIQQPDERLPGINAWFGNEFNRHNTWFSYMDLFTDYLKRCNFMLQQGKYAADVAYFIGEDAPKMTGVTDPALPKGYAFDYINAEVIKRINKVENGRIYLNDGMNYGLLVLPKLETMRPELLKKIMKLVAQGAVILGPAPMRSPSLEKYPNADEKVQQMAKTLWGDIDGQKIKEHLFGKGMVLSNMDMQTALNKIKVIADVDLATQKDSVLYIHRKTNEGEIYFLSNQSQQEISFAPSFRVKGKQPELWNAMNGTLSMLNSFTQNAITTIVPLQLAPLESAFIVFRKDATVSNVVAANFPEKTLVQTISSPWTVKFDYSLRGPKEAVVFNQLIDWTKSKNDSIKYYSGTAVYNNTFQVKLVKRTEKLFLNVGEIKGMAKVKINGIYVGGLWTFPWQLDVSSFVQKGNNTVEISVVNTWANRLIGDCKLPEAQRKTFTLENPYKSDSKLEPAGLTGPVKILKTN